MNICLNIFTITQLLLFAFFGKINGQVNLVPNPSFESYTSCPESGGEIYNAIGWDSYNGSVDYYNSCSIISSYQTPNNGFGYQLPANGNAYAGLIAYWNNGTAPEIVGIQLTTSLTISQKYYISFYVTLSGKNNLVGYSCNRMGVKLSKVALYNAPINNTAQYYYNSIISDTLNWTKFFGSFIADSSYKNIMIGNFFDNTNTSIINHSSGEYAYYFIDNVCLSSDSAFCQNYVYVGINENKVDDTFRIFPNPVNNIINISGELKMPLKIFNNLGNNIDFILEEKNGMLSINCSKWQSGLYVIRVNNFNHKIIINH